MLLGRAGFQVGMHRILILPDMPDIRQIQKLDTGYPAGFLTFANIKESM
jgi:hypothetical protein